MSRISWNQNQKKRLENAVRRYNYHVKKMQQSGLYDYVPEPTSYSKEKDRIYTRQQLYTREKQLDRIRKTGAANQVEYNDYVVPAYLRNEIRYAIRDINKDRREFRLKHFPDTLTDVEYITALSGSNFADIDTIGYFTGEDLEDLVSSIFPDISERVNLYLALFQDNMSNYEGYDEALSVIDRMLKQYPDKLLEILESNLEEVDIGYIYPSMPVPNVEGINRTFKVEGKTYNYKGGNAPNQTPEKTRIENVTNFWKYVGNKYLGENYHVKSNLLERYEEDNILDNLVYRPRKKQNRKEK